MKKLGKSTKKGFTLVELIVVLVILAVLAAMLVPALTGYITRARQEKNYQAASTVYTAAQSLATEAYGKNEALATYLTLDNIKELAGSEQIEKFAYTMGTATPTNKGLAYQITVFSVKFTNDTSWYNYSASTNKWEPGQAPTGSTTVPAGN